MRGKKIEESSEDDLDEFVLWLEEKEASANAILWGLTLFFEFKENKRLKQKASELRTQRITKVDLKIREFRGLDLAVVEKLEEIGLSTIADIHGACRTSEMRKEVARRIGVSEDVILEITKLSDFGRIQGLKGIRARLYYDAGVTTLDELATWDPVELRKMLIAFIEKTKFDGVAPWPKEARNAVETARTLERIIEY